MFSSSPTPVLFSSPRNEYLSSRRLYQLEAKTSGHAALYLHFQSHKKRTKDGHVKDVFENGHEVVVTDRQQQRRTDKVTSNGCVTKSSNNKKANNNGVPYRNGGGQQREHHIVSRVHPVQGCLFLLHGFLVNTVGAA